MRACVPIKIGISPFATHFKSCAREIVVQLSEFVLEGNFRQPDPVIKPIFIGSPPAGGLKYSIKDSKCWVARISVGAMYATCKEVSPPLSEVEPPTVFHTPVRGSTSD